MVLNVKKQQTATTNSTSPSTQTPHESQPMNDRDSSWASRQLVPCLSRRPGSDACNKIHEQRPTISAHAIATAAATISAANNTPFAWHKFRIRSFVHARDPEDSPTTTRVAVRLDVAGFSPATVPCFLSSFRAIHFSRSRGSIPSSSICSRKR